MMMRQSISISRTETIITGSPANGFGIRKCTGSSLNSRNQT